MPYYEIDHAVAFAIDAPAKASDMQKVDQNIDYLKALMAIATGHTHDQGGTDQGGPVVPAAASVSQSKLKTTTGEVSTTATAFTNLTLPGGTYGFYPQVRATGGTSYLLAAIAGVDVTTGSYVTNISLKVSAGSGSVYAQQRYVQASPPYKIGDKVWGHFLFLLRDIATGTVKASYEAEDPPWAYNGAVWLPKDDPGRLAEVPHPFADYWQKDPAIDGLEIVLVDLTMLDVKKVKLDNAKTGKGLLEDIPALITGKGKQKAHTDYLLPNIPRFSEQVKIYEQ